MSHRAQDWVWDQDANLTAVDKYTLAALANFANADDLAWPSIETLCNITKLGRATVFRALKNLLAHGYLRVVERRWRSLPCFQILGVSERDASGDGVSIRDYGVSERDCGVSVGDSTKDTVGTSKEPVIEPEGGKGTASSTDTDKLTPEDLKNGWNKICGGAGLAKVRELSESRKAKVRLRIKEHPSQDWWEEVMTRIIRSAFCLGMRPGTNGRRPFKATFKWLIKNDENALNAYEGLYDD